MRTLVVIALGSLLLSTACVAAPGDADTLAYEQDGII
jgi:hypothetical protein